jgi:alditol oxidase
MNDDEGRQVPSKSKRTFIKLSVSTVVASVFARMSAWASSSKLTNWAGNIEYSTERLFAANTVAQVKEFAAKHGKFKVLGTRHCFNRIADSTDEFLSVRPMSDVVAMDPKARTVTVNAGASYGQLSPYLDSKGFALHNLASLPHISVAGACSTATHGSGEKNGNLASAVAGLEIVTPDGEMVTLSRKDGEKFNGAVVGLGALGVITKVTLDVQPTYKMAQYVYQDLPLRELADNFDAIEGSAYSVSLFTDWEKQRINELWLKCKMDEAQKFQDKPEFFGAKRASRNVHPIIELSAENCTEQMGVPGPWYERLPHFRMGFTPSAGKELQSEYFVPRKHAVEAILAVEKLHEQVSPHLMITEIRTIASDSLWMSPCYKQPSVTIHFTWKQDWPAVSKLLPVIEKELAPFDARPHWGKLFSIAPATLRKRYEKLPEFVELARKFDPKRKLRNHFLNTNIFGT